MDKINIDIELESLVLDYIEKRDGELCDHSIILELLLLVLERFGAESESCTELQDWLGLRDIHTYKKMINFIIKDMEA